MKRLLRSVIDVDGKITQENLVLNFQKLYSSRIGWDRAQDDLKIYEYILRYFQQRLEVPSLQTLQDYFDKANDIEVGERLGDIAAAPSYIRSNFDHLLKSILEQQNTVSAVTLLKETHEIVTRGLDITEGREKIRKQGVRDGLLYFASKASELIIPEYNARTKGMIKLDGQSVWSDYQNAKSNKANVWGKFCGLDAIDRVCHGIKRGELWVHAAYPGELKCLPGDATIYDHRTHRRRTMAELFATQELPIVTALDREGLTHRLVLAESSHIIENGVQDVFDLRLTSGRGVGATANHRFFTPLGWRRLDELREGDLVAVPGIMRADPPRIDGDLTWDVVASVSYRGCEMTYDLSVPQHHSFVANDIITHNTSLALNWAYNLMTRYRTNTVYWSLEMPYEQVRRMLYVLHSANLRWRLAGYKPLDYRRVRDGELTPEEEVFYQLVIRDFCTNPEYCEIDILAPDHEVTMDDIKFETEMLHRQKDVGFVVLDHGQEIEARKTKRSKDYVVELNSVVRDAKRMALHFNHGEKVPILMLFQINRQGKEEAVKNEGRYKTSAIAYANQVEKSSDVITTTFLDDEHRKNGTTFICNLKNRDNPQFEPFRASIEWGSRRITNMEVTPGSNMGVEEHVSLFQEMHNL